MTQLLPKLAFAGGRRFIGLPLIVLGVEASAATCAVVVSGLSEPLFGSIAARRMNTGTWDCLCGGHSPRPELARSGQLARRSRAATREVQPETATVRLDALAAGRETQAAWRIEEVRIRLEALGAPTLHEYLQRAYRAGASLDDLGRDTGLGRSQLRDAMTEAGIILRPCGVNTAAGKRSRAAMSDRVAAGRVGTTTSWSGLPSAGLLATRSPISLAPWATAHWVRWRLERTVNDFSPAAPATGVVDETRT